MDFIGTETQPPGNAMRRLESRFYVILRGLIVAFYWILTTSAISSFTQNSDVIPPVIIEGPPVYKIFNPKGMTSLPCTAIGTLPLTYEWYRNEKLLAPKPNSRIQNGPEGSLILNQPEEGFYQCRVENDAGAAVTNITHLQAAVFEDANKRTPTEHIIANAFQYLHRPCYHILRSIPAATITWEDSDGRPVALSNRVVVTDDGSLVFTSLFPSDSNRDNNSFYKCVAYNSETKRSIGGSYFNLKVKGVDTGNQNGAPKLIYSSKDTVRVLEDQPFSLWCIFGGVNSSGALWLLPNKTTVSPAWQLNLPKAKSSDAGNYTCSVAVGGTLRHTTEKVIRVIVDALPQLETPLQSQRVQRGGFANFTCRGFGRPLPTISWIINGTLYNSTEYGRNQSVDFQNHGSYHGYSLILHDVQNSASVACNVSNKYGYQLSSSYLIVGDTVATTSSQGQSSVTSASSHLTSRGMTSTTRRGGSSTAESTLEINSSTGNGKVAKTSTTSHEINHEEQKNVSDSAPPESNISILIPIVIGAVILVIMLVIIVLSYVLCRRRRKKQSYSISPQDQHLGLKVEYNREQDAVTCDSDDSGYDDIGRKPSASLKHTKRLSDTPEETCLSFL